MPTPVSNIGQAQLLMPPSLRMKQPTAKVSTQTSRVNKVQIVQVK